MDEDYNIYKIEYVEEKDGIQSSTIYVAFVKELNYYDAIISFRKDAKPKKKDAYLKVIKFELMEDIIILA